MNSLRKFEYERVALTRHKTFSRQGSRPEPLSIDQQQIDLAVPESISNGAEVRVAFESLSAEHRDILHLGVVKGFSVRELAALLAIPPGTVMSRLSRARARLRMALRHSEMAQQLQ